MDIVNSHGRESVARVYLGLFGDGTHVEMVESRDPDVPISEKWVLIVSSLAGCPFGCVFCDAGGSYSRPLTSEELLDQILFLIRNRYPDLSVPVPKFKIQFARIGEPTLNPGILQTLRELPDRVDAPGLLPCISTIAPHSAGPFLSELLTIKNEFYPRGFFQLQFSIHTTDNLFRKRIIPARTWTVEKISKFGAEWFQAGDRKVTLNFALSEEFPFDPYHLIQIFDPELFLIKITPINPTGVGEKRNFRSVYPDPDPAFLTKVETLREHGFTVLESIGNLEENEIGSNCGQYLSHLTGT